MSRSDPLGDMIAAIRNANLRGRQEAAVDHSRLKEAVCRVMAEEGFLQEVAVQEDPQLGSKKRTLRIRLKYGPDGEKVIRGLRRISKPGRRIFVKCEEIQKVLDGFGISILSTNRGVLSDRRARALKLGGEVLCEVW